MAALVLVEHDHHSLKAATHHAVSAAKLCSPEVDLLLIGSNAGAIAQAAAGIAGIRKVLHADATQFIDQLPESVAEQMIALASDYDYFLAPATAHGKSVMPRVAAKLDIAQLSDITRVVSGDTFERPIYAGNAIATVQSSDAKKVITVRTTNFEAAPEGGSAVIESIKPVDPYEASQFIGRDLSYPLPKSLCLVGAA
jgi:electron transfer flavoprotein alpha subunit